MSGLGASTRPDGRRVRLARVLPQTGIAAWACLVLACLASAAVAAEDPAYAWFPLDPGRRLRFESERERSVERPSGVQRAVYRGHAELHVGARRGQLSPVSRVESESPTSLVGAARPTVSQSVELYASSARQLGLHAQRSVGGSEGEVVYDPPRILLQTPLEPGRSWSVGELQSGELRLDLEAEVVGIEALEAGGRRHDQALQVRYHGPVTGRIGDFDVRSGSYERRVWFARGTGVVREEIEIDLETREEGGAPVHLRDRVSLRLAPPGDREAAKPDSLLR